MKKLINIKFFCIICVLIISLAGCTKSVEFPKHIDKKSTSYENSEVRQLENLYIIENDSLLLTLDSSTLNMIIEDKANNYKYISSVSEDMLDKEPNELWLNTIQSILSFTCVDSESKSDDVLTVHSFSEKPNTNIKKIESGISLDLNFQKYEIQISLQVLLKDKKLEVSIPQIIEKGKYHVVDITPLPYFGHAQDQDDGYFFYPNGTGEIFRFKQRNKRQNSIKTYSLPLYSQYNTDMQKRYNISSFDKEEINIMLPVFGVKINENAFVAIIEQGDADARIDVTPGGVGVAVNRINATFTYRHQYQVENVGLDISGGVNQFPLALLYDKEYIEGNRVISYEFLSKENANYSGMARATRNNFIEREILNKNIEESQMPLSIDLFMGITKSQIVVDEFVTTTNFNQATQILKDLKNNGLKNIYANLLGWNKNGYNSGIIKPTSKNLGGEKGLEKLSKFCKESNIELFADANLVEIIKDKTSYSTSADTAKDQNGFVYQDKSQENLLFGPYSVWQNNKSFVNYTKNQGFSGITYDVIGDFIYSDFSKNKKSNRQQTIDVWENILKESKENIGGVACVGGNAYTLFSTDLVKNTDSVSDFILFSDESIPFYQMVVHGSVYCLSSPMNLFYDPDIQLLNMVEYGYVPHFELTYERAVDLRDTEYNMLFSSCYDNLKEDIIKLYNRFDKDFNGLWNKNFTRHEKINDFVFLTVYDENIEVYINYGEKPYSNGNITVNAYDYFVNREGTK